MTGFGTLDSLYVLAGGKLLKTFDGGRSWSSTPLPRPTSSGMFTDAMNGIILFSDSVARTTDGGDTWVEHYSVVSRPKCWTHVGRDVLYIGGSFVASKSTDGGDTWHGMNFPGDANGIAFLNENIGYAMGPALLWTGPPPPQPGSRGANFLLTHDGGNYWKTVWSKIDYEDVNALFETANGTLVAAAHNIFSTYDEGHNWDTTILRDNGGFSAVHFADTLHGCAAGVNGHISWTDDGGFTWRDVSFPTLLDFYGVQVVDSATAYVGGESGLLIKTTNAGLSWVVPSPSGSFLVSVYPNPSHDHVRFTYDLPEAHNVSLTIYDTRGEVVARPIQAVPHDVGQQVDEVLLNSLSNGVYAYILRAGDSTAFGSFTIVR